MTLDNKHSSEPRASQPVLPGPLVEPPAPPNPMADDLPTADLAAITNGGDNHPFNLDGPATCIGRKRKARDLHAILEVCMCGQVVTDGEVSNGEGIIRCKSVGCETGWVSIVIPREQKTYH